MSAVTYQNVLGHYDTSYIGEYQFVLF